VWLDGAFAAVVRTFFWIYKTFGFIDFSKNWNPMVSFTLHPIKTNNLSK
jgi:hypothetical protein